jgi:hypothetical protein
MGIYYEVGWKIKADITRKTQNLACEFRLANNKNISHKA